VSRCDAAISGGAFGYHRHARTGTRTGKIQAIVDGCDRRIKFWFTSTCATQLILPYNLLRTSRAAAVLDAMGKSYAPRVAIVGGGVSGLVAGASLSAAGLDVSLFDTGENATGGRMSSRQVGPWEFDHSTQYFTVSPGSEFSRTVEEWEARGWVTRWPEGAVGVLSVADSQFSPLSDGLPRYIGVDGFTALCEGLAAQCTRVVRPQWVGAMSPAANTRWNLSKSVGGRPLGDPYDFVLIAHNGKCAARLAGTAKTSDGNSAASKVVTPQPLCTALSYH
jgi:predicted NAD/FAD-dependent oxidoreductase